MKQTLSFIICILIVAALLANVACSSKPKPITVVETLQKERKVEEGGPTKPVKPPPFFHCSHKVGSTISAEDTFKLIYKADPVEIDYTITMKTNGGFRLEGGGNIQPSVSQRADILELCWGEENCLILKKNNDRTWTIKSLPFSETTPETTPPRRRQHSQKPSPGAPNPIISQPWQKVISILESFDSEMYRLKELSDLKSQLPSGLSPDEFISILKLFDSDIYQLRVVSDLKSQLLSRLSLGEFILILKLFDSEAYRLRVVSGLKSQLPSGLSPDEFILILKLFDSEAYRLRVVSGLKSQLPSHLSLNELTSILESFDSEAYRSRVRSDLKDRLTFH